MKITGNQASNSTSKQRAKPSIADKVFGYNRNSKADNTIVALGILGLATFGASRVANRLPAGAIRTAIETTCKIFQRFNPFG